MVKAFIKYFLAVLILFLSVSIYALPLNRKAPADQTDQASVEEQHLLHNVSDEIAATLYVSKSKHHLEPYEIELEEDDDERSSLLKRASSTSKYLLVLCLALLLGYYHNPIKLRSPSNEQSYHFSLFKWCVLFQVFRI